MDKIKYTEYGMKMRTSFGEVGGTMMIMIMISNDVIMRYVVMNSIFFFSIRGCHKEMSGSDLQTTLVQTKMHLWDTNFINERAEGCVHFN